MISIDALRELARARLRDATILFKAHRYDAADYICGYAVEIALKARICRTLRWEGFPQTNSDWRDLHSFKTHNLKILLRLSGHQARIQGKYQWAWSLFDEWNAEMRYNAIGSAKPMEVKARLVAARTLVRAI